MPKGIQVCIMSSKSSRHFQDRAKHKFALPKEGCNTAARKGP